MVSQSLGQTQLTSGFGCMMASQRTHALTPSTANIGGDCIILPVNNVGGGGGGGGVNSGEDDAVVTA